MNHRTRTQQLEILAKIGPLAVLYYIVLYCIIFHACSGRLASRWDSFHGVWASQVEHADVVAESLSDPDWVVRKTAAECLGEMGRGVLHVMLHV